MMSCGRDRGRDSLLHANGYFLWRFLAEDVGVPGPQYSIARFCTTYYYRAQEQAARAARPVGVSPGRGGGLSPRVARRGRPAARRGTRGKRMRGKGPRPFCSLFRPGGAKEIPGATKAHLGPAPTAAPLGRVRQLTTVSTGCAPPAVQRPVLHPRLQPAAPLGRKR